MEDGVKEEPARTKEPTFLGKAGWVKRSTSRFLGSYRDRYIQVEKTEVVVYENEDLQTCLERVNLENYDKCLELRSAFLKKNRLVLIQTPKSGNKVHDVKFQAPNPEEKEAWIKAFSDGISRAKNKVFDEVKIDEGNNLDHVTRTRPKGNRNRRPPTRIHMKEVASTSSDGNLRMDLDITDSGMPNGYDTETPKETIKPPMPPSKPSESTTEAQASDSTDAGRQIEAEPSPKKTVLKPPMPPSKEVKPTAFPEEELLKDASPEKKVLKPPMPPSNAVKPRIVGGPETLEETCPESDPMESSETELSPPNKPISSSTDNLTEDTLSTPDLKPPAPPSKDKKPTQPTVEHNLEATPSDLDDATEVEEGEEEQEEEEEEQEEEEEMALKKGSSDMIQAIVPYPQTEPAHSAKDPSLPDVKEQLGITDLPVCTATDGEVSKVPAVPSEGKDCAPNKETVKLCLLPSATSTVPTAELIKKSPGQPALPKKKPIKLPPSKAMAHVEPSTQPRDENTITITQCEESPNPLTSPQTTTVCVSDPGDEVKLQVESKSDLPVVFVSLNDLVADNLSLGIMEKKEGEEKSVDSGQHSDDDGEESEAGDMLMASTSALHGSHAGLDLLDGSEDDAESPDSAGQVVEETTLHPTMNQPSQQNQSKIQVSSCPLHSTIIQGNLRQTARPPLPIKPSAMTRSASVGDFLSESSGCDKMRHSAVDNVHDDVLKVSSDNVIVLQSQVSLELEKTRELLGTMAQSKGVDSGEKTSEELLVKAMEKLKIADQFLREASSVRGSKCLENSRKRNSF